MRSDQHVLHVPELAVCHKRFFLENIKDCSGDGLVLESLDEVFFLDCWASSDIHEHCCGLHLRESRGVEEVFGIRNLRENSDDKVCL